MITNFLKLFYQFQEIYYLKRNRLIIFKFNSNISYYYLLLQLLQAKKKTKEIN